MVGDDLDELGDTAGSTTLQPVGVALVELGSGRLREQLVRHAANQRMAERKGPVGLQRRRLLA